MSAETVEIMAPAAALAIIERHAEKQADDICMLFDDPHDRALLAMYLSEAAEILGRDTQGAVLRNAQEEAALVALQGRSYKLELAIEALRKRRLKPLQDEVRAINLLLGTDSNPGGLVFGQLLSRMGKSPLADANRRQAAWRAAERSRIAREQEEAARKQEEAARREEEALSMAAAATTPELRARAQAQAEMASADLQRADLEMPRGQVRGVVTEDGKKTYHEEWTFEVVDASLVPREYLMVNEAAIRVAVRPKDGVRQIPGVNIYPVERSRRGV